MFCFVITSFPHWQDCHEMWSKKRRKELRENARLAAEGKASSHDTSHEQTKPSQVCLYA